MSHVSQNYSSLAGIGITVRLHVHSAVLVAMQTEQMALMTLRPVLTGVTCVSKNSPLCHRDNSLFTDSCSKHTWSRVIINYITDAVN